MVCGKLLVGQWPEFLLDGRGEAVLPLQNSIYFKASARRSGKDSLCLIYDTTNMLIATHCDVITSTTNEPNPDGSKHR